MKTLLMKRRAFLKSLTSLIVGIAFLPFKRFFYTTDKIEGNTLHPKEAKYYTRRDDLAG